VTRTVLGRALGLAAAGLIAGVPIAAAGKRIAASLIERLPLESTFPIGLAVAVMIAVSLAAAYLPARRAARVDPIVALRHD
jgi:ABC-type antimicrobial peptide transport system permease subunit